MRVTKYVFTREQSRLAALLTVASGYFRVITGKIFEISGMTIRTMTATGSIRGTDWMGVASDESTQIFVSSGEVVVRSLYLKEQGEVVLRAGEGTVINQNNAPAAKKRWPQSKVNQFLTSTDVN